MAIMMVGTPGSGKSYSAVELCIVPALEGGRPVRTNIPLRVEACKARWPDADVACIDVRSEGVWQSMPGGALVVVDEVGALWPARQAPTDAGPAVEWLAMHRHRVGLVRGVEVATDVVLISQGSTDLAGWARSKIDRTYILRKLDAVGGASWYRCDWYQGWVDSRKPPQRQHIGGGRGTYKAEVYSLYQSHTKADTGVSAVAVKELRADGKRSIWSSWTMRLAGIGILGMGWAVWTFLSQGGSFFMGGAADKGAPRATGTGELASPVQSPRALPAVVARPVVPPTTAMVSALVGPVADPGELAEWRLRAFIGPRSDGTFAIVATRGRDRRQLDRVSCGSSLSGEWRCAMDDGRWATSASGVSTDMWSSVDAGPGPSKSVEQVREQEAKPAKAGRS